MGISIHTAITGISDSVLCCYEGATGLFYQWVS